jgi:hypothetical protein
MTTIVQDIQMVRSLRKDIREVKLPSNILNSIETIHNCIKSGTDLNGWKKVDWRGAGGGGSSNSGGNNYRNSGPPSRQGQGYNRGNDRSLHLDLHTMPLVIGQREDLQVVKLSSL